ncbi:class A beta-lactamase-related serine hydrolase [Pseudoalteromonas sp. R3]|nr:class A beta-lactamase-related serine hydrolase [Pseudoalteromonas sp. R3]
MSKHPGEFRLNRTLILLISAWLSFGTSAKQGISVSEQQERISISKSIEQIVSNYVSNGVFEGSILVSDSNKKIFENTYGFANLADRIPITKNSSFQIASLSKPITATIVLILREQGKLKLDDTLARYFPEFNNGKGKKITIRHLLSHTSGIPNHFIIDGWFSKDFHTYTSEQAFIETIAKLPLNSEPGEEYLYSNPGYFLLGKIIEKVTGESFSSSANKAVFEPLNMSNSGVSLAGQQDTKIVKAYQLSAGGGYQLLAEKNMKLFGAGAAIYSNAENLYRFESALYGEKLISNESKKDLFNPDRPFSWRVGVLPIGHEIQPRVHMYDGKIDGFSSMMVRFIDEQKSIILLSNIGTSYFLKKQLVMDIAAALYNQDIPNRTRDVSLALTNGVRTGTFEQVLSEIENDKYDLDESSMTSMAYELLWSGLADKSLKLFSLINRSFSNSPTAESNLVQACNHRLTKNVHKKSEVCKIAL